MRGKGGRKEGLGTSQRLLLKTHESVKKDEKTNVENLVGKRLVIKGLTRSGDRQKQRLKIFSERSKQATQSEKV